MNNYDGNMNRTQLSFGPQQFQFKEGNCATDWRNWLRGFELFAMANGIRKKADKRNWLLHYAGPKVQNVYFNLPEKSKKEKKGPMLSGYKPFKKDQYLETVVKLQDYFAPKQNVSYERHVYRKMFQEKGGRIDLFAMRLRIQDNRCNFGNQEDENIKDQITSGCHSESLRRKILLRGDEDLDAILKLARVSEAVYEQQKMFSNEPKHRDIAPPQAMATEVCEIENRHC